MQRPATTIRRLTTRALLCMACLLAPFASAEIDDDQRLPLRVGITVEFEPVAFEVAGEPQGIEVDFAHLLGEKLERTIEFSIFPFAELLDALEAGKVDIVMAGMSITEERQERVLFSEPYMVVGQMGIVRAEDASRFAGPASMQASGLKVGVHLGSTGEQYVIDNMPRANLIAYESVESALAALRNGEINLVIHDSTTSFQLHRSFVNDNLISLNRFLTRESIGWATRKTDRELHSLVNYALREMKEDGVVAEVIGEWLPMLPVTIGQ